MIVPKVASKIWISSRHSRGVAWENRETMY